MPWVPRGLRDGVVTTGYPRRADPYADSWPSGIDVLSSSADPAVELLCPTGAITSEAGGLLRLDRGRCILCGACVRARPDLFAWRAGAQSATLTRQALVVPDGPDDAAVEAVRARLATRVRALHRSVHIRHVDTGSDGSEEWEIHALLNPVYDVGRLGIFFTASPRHADILLVTGAGSHGMTAPLLRTLEAMPAPTVVIAAGTDAISGGLTAPTYAVAGGVGRFVPVDVWVPGSPPSPFSLLHGILLALGRVPGRRPSGRSG